MHEHNDWIKYAEGDLRSAKIILKNEDDLVIGNILYLSQQCAEKSLKAYLAYQKQEIPKIHDLLKLVRLCAQFDEEFLNLSPAAIDLNPFTTGGRYPDSGFVMPDSSVAHFAVKQASKIFEFVYGKI